MAKQIKNRTVDRKSRLELVQSYDYLPIDNLCDFRLSVSLYSTV